MGFVDIHSSWRLAASIVCLGLAAAAAYAAETVTYTYDARGRLVKVEHAGDINPGLKTEYSHDKADNRTNVTVTGSAGIIGTPGNDNPLNGTANNDTVHALAGNDNINLSQGGNDTVYGGAGTDISYFGATFNDLDMIDAGPDLDSVALRGSYTINFNSGNYAATLVNVETVSLLSSTYTVYESGGGPFTYTITAHDSMVAAGVTMTFNGGGLGVGETVTFNGAGETNGHLRLFAGSANDVLTAGAGNDLIYGGLGTDRMTGGAGADTFRIDAASHSTGAAYDTIVGFSDQADKIDLTVAITSFGSTIATGALSTSSFDTDMATAMSSLAIGQARLFTPNSGTLSGKTFLIINLNGTAGYQSGADLVLEMESPAALAAQSTSIFI